MTDRVTCPICNKAFKMINHSHIEMHGLTTEEFRMKYPNQPLCCKDTYKTLTTIGRQALVDFNKSEKSRSMASTRCKILNQDTIRQRNKQKAMIQKMHYEERDAYRESREHAIQGLSRRLRGTRNLYKLKSGEVLNLDSFLEGRIAKLFEVNDIEFIHEAFTVSYIDPNTKKTRLYYPDFYLPKYNLVVEGKAHTKLDDIVVLAKAEATKQQGYKYMFITELDMDNPKDVLSTLALLVK